MGNPSADMDSVLCAIVASWFFSEVQPTKAKVLYSPLVNVPREELQLRFDIVEWLHENGFDEEFITNNIFFYDDLTKEGKNEKTTVESVGLVDFNQLTREAEYLTSKVHIILDHHSDYKVYKDTCEVRDI
jgi:inorganic pyrophosphatase/exopolyphosphatase